MKNWRKFYLSEDNSQLSSLDIDLSKSVEELEPELEGLGTFLTHPKVEDLVAQNLSKIMDTDGPWDPNKAKQLLPSRINIAELLKGLNIPIGWQNIELEASLEFADITKPLDPNNPPKLYLGLAGEF